VFYGSGLRGDDVMNLTIFNCEVNNITALYTIADIFTQTH